MSDLRKAASVLADELEGNAEFPRGKDNLRAAQMLRDCVAALSTPADALQQFVDSQKPLAPEDRPTPQQLWDMYDGEPADARPEQEETMLVCKTLCVECGPNVAIDDDGCCVTCGATAMGSWLAATAAALSRPATAQETLQASDQQLLDWIVRLVDNYAGDAAAWRLAEGNKDDPIDFSGLRSLFWRPRFARVRCGHDEGTHLIEALGHWFKRGSDGLCDEVASRPATQQETTVHGVVFVLLRDGHVLLERCPRKREVLGVGEWFLPGGKLEAGESEGDALRREMAEELGVSPFVWCPLPVIEGSPIPPTSRGVFLMRPYLVTEWRGDLPLPLVTLDQQTPLRWVPIEEALLSPVPQVRGMVAMCGAFRPATASEPTHFLYESGRCQVCGWPLKESIEEGCTTGNCAFRPRPRTRETPE